MHLLAVMVVVLRVNVTCHKCKKQVAKLETRQLKSNPDTPKYECFECFKMVHPNRAMLNHEPVRVKRNFYCERCRYSFASKVPECPYCAKDDCLESGSISIHDLL